MSLLLPFPYSPPLFPIQVGRKDADSPLRANLVITVVYCTAVPAKRILSDTYLLPRK